MPAPAMPWVTMRFNSASLSRAASEPDAILGARSPPLPSSPWQPLQVERNSFLPPVPLESWTAELRWVCAASPQQSPTPRQAVIKRADSFGSKVSVRLRIRTSIPVA